MTLKEREQERKDQREADLRVREITQRLSSLSDDLVLTVGELASLLKPVQMMTKETNK